MNFNLQYVLIVIKYSIFVFALQNIIHWLTQFFSRRGCEMGDKNNLAGKVALITGGSRGVGAAIGRRLAADGAYVVLAARSRDAGDAVVADIRSKGGRAEFRTLDVTDEYQWQELVASIEQQQQGLHALINNAGVHQIRPFRSTGRDDFDWLVNTNLLGPYLGMKSCIPLLGRSGSSDDPARIINMSSVAALAPMGRQVLYNMTKSGLDSMTKSIAVEMGHDHLPINANTVNPGVIETEMGDDLVRQLVDEGIFRDQASAVRNLQRNLAIKRFATPEEVAAAVAFLCSAETNYITGISLPVDGGLTLH
jgi:NAD(P)-dependent dehydrogenase (short-subunit alcohol dehydrogenase family)